MHEGRSNSFSFSALHLPHHYYSPHDVCSIRSQHASIAVPRITSIAHYISPRVHPCPYAVSHS